ncbi:MAG: DNA repair protein RadA, partial [Candidatus Gracilibacteria bacterium]|nr:DNA repair protein RadA [Candidatus Gracilibacteria bacterium]
VLGGGITPGSLVLLSGEPGVGKSTLTLQIADWFGKPNHNVIYVSGEENAYQISDRAKRLGIKNSYIKIFNSNILENILKVLEDDDSDLVIIDSISMIYSENLDSNSGSVSQIRYITEIFMNFCKKAKKSVILIGHVTKDGTISGPKTLEHLVDVVLYLEGNKYENYRILRSMKNRFGPTDEIGIFDMTETGLQDVKNVGVEFISQDSKGLSGRSLVMTIEGTRPILIEIEALTTYTKFGYPKRSSRGIASTKLDLLIAVINKFTDVKLESYDVYVNIGRGLSIQEPGIDLGIIASIISSKTGKPLDDIVFIGEVSLTGIVKNVMRLKKRVEEAKKLGFKTIVIPAGIEIDAKISKDIEILKVKNVKELAVLIK